MTNTIDNTVKDAMQIPVTLEAKKKMYANILRARCIECDAKYDNNTVNKAAEDLANGNYNSPYLKDLQNEL